MGLILDTDDLIRGEKRAIVVVFTLWVEHGDVYVSPITCSEPMVGILAAFRKIFVASLACLNCAAYVGG